MPFTQKLVWSSGLTKAPWILLSPWYLHHFRICHKDSASLLNSVLSFSFCVGSSLKEKPKKMGFVWSPACSQALQYFLCKYLGTIKWFKSSSERQWKEPPPSWCHGFRAALLNTESGYKTSTHFWLSRQSSWWENLASLRSLRAHNFSPEPFNSAWWKVSNKPLNGALFSFSPLAWSVTPPPFIQSSLSILNHVPYCSTWSRGNWNFLMQQSSDNSNTASVERAGAIAGHGHSSTQRGLAYFSTETQATEERPLCLKLAWENTNGVMCQFPEAKETTLEEMGIYFKLA